MSELETRQQNFDAPAASERWVPTSRLDPRQDLMEYLEAYTRENPKVVALWCFGLGFILGWKLKPW
ncbi:MAG: hypothetical protein WD069_16465 [Planctomycetales bacterium]